MNKLVTIVLPVYNTELYLDTAIASIVAQTYKNLEIILIDDDSTDNSYQIMKEWKAKDNRIQIIHNDHIGLSAIRNLGINIAKGVYIAFLDSDDYIDPDYIEKLVFNIEKYNSDMTMTATKIYFNGEYDGILRPYRTKVCTKLEDKLKLLRGGGVRDKLYRLDFLKKNSIYFPEGRYYEGNIFLVKAAYYAKVFSFIPDTFYHYLCRENSICTNQNPEFMNKKLDDRCWMIVELCNFMKEKKFNRKQRRVVYKLIAVSVCDVDDIFERRMFFLIKHLGFNIFYKKKIFKKIFLWLKYQFSKKGDI